MADSRWVGRTFGGCALAWNAAMRGLAIARAVALGGVAHAAQANEAMASQFMKASQFFRRMEVLSHYVGWFWLIPLVGWWRMMAKRAN